MLPSMPILFNRDSQDAFGNKIEATTSFFGQNNLVKHIIQTKPSCSSALIKPVPPVIFPPPQPAVPKEVKGKGGGKKKEILKEEPPPAEEINQESALVSAYFAKVQSRFASNTRVPVNNKFDQFKDLLKQFDVTKESPIDLFKKIEELFGEEQKDLAEEFLLFLTAGQAAEVGRFMDYFTLIQLNSFIQLLQVTFSRKPAMLRKVLRAITNSLNCGTIEEMKAKVLPHLRSNPKLSQKFKSLFPDERPPDSLYENGVELLPESFVNEPRSYESWTYKDKKDSDRRRNLSAKRNLDSVYLQGRVFVQQGKNLRPARVTFPYSKEPYRVHSRRLAPAHTRHSPPETDEELSPKRNITKNQPKKKKAQAKTKSIKDVNDNTKNVVSPKSKKNIKRTQKDKNDTPKRDKKERHELKSEGSKAKQPKLEESKTEDLKETECEDKEGEKIEEENKKNGEDTKSNSWTREEDKTMLEVLKGEAVTDQVFIHISQLLPHRSVTDIKERFFHVMTLLQQMSVGEIT